MTSFSSLWKKLRQRQYRRAFASSQLIQGIPFQVKALREARGWTQAELAERAGLPQSSISRAEDMNYGGLSLATILKIAEGFDVGFMGRFVPFSELARWHTNLEHRSFDIPSFDDDPVELREESTNNVIHFRPPSTSSSWDARSDSSSQYDDDTDEVYARRCHA